MYIIYYTCLRFPYYVASNLRNEFVGISMDSAPISFNLPGENDDWGPVGPFQHGTARIGVEFCADGCHVPEF